MGGSARAGSGSYAKRWLIWPALILAGLGTVAAAVLFAWPQDSPGRTRFDMGSIDAYSVGSVTTVEEGAFHLVRVSDDVFLALSWRDSHFRHCRVPWKPDFVWPPRSNDASQGWFRDPCGGSTYDITGRRVFGPASRDLDRYSVAIVGDNVIVNTDRYVCGIAPPGAACERPSPPP